MAKKTKGGRAWEQERGTTLQSRAAAGGEASDDGATPSSALNDNNFTPDYASPPRPIPSAPPSKAVMSHFPSDIFASSLHASSASYPPLFISPATSPLPTTATGASPSSLPTELNSSYPTRGRPSTPSQTAGSDGCQRGLTEGGEVEGDQAQSRDKYFSESDQTKGTWSTRDNIPDRQTTFGRSLKSEQRQQHTPTAPSPVLETQQLISLAGQRPINQGPTSLGWAGFIRDRESGAQNEVAHPTRFNNNYSNPSSAPRNPRMLELPEINQVYHRRPPVFFCLPERPMRSAFCECASLQDAGRLIAVLIFALSIVRLIEPLPTDTTVQLFCALTKVPLAGTIWRSVLGFLTSVAGVYGTSCGRPSASAVLCLYIAIIAAIDWAAIAFVSMLMGACFFWKTGPIEQQCAVLARANPLNTLILAGMASFAGIYFLHVLWSLKLHYSAHQAGDPWAMYIAKGRHLDIRSFERDSTQHLPTTGSFPGDVVAASSQLPAAALAYTSRQDEATQLLQQPGIYRVAPGPGYGRALQISIQLVDNDFESPSGGRSYPGLRVPVTHDNFATTALPPALPSHSNNPSV